MLRRAAQDGELVARARALEAEIAADLERPYRAGPVDPAHPVGFLCAEYGVHVSLPVYSGGLGALAGDLLKEASDQAVPLVAVGLMYRKGYFRQRIDASGWQHEYWIDTDPDRLPAALVTGRDAAPVTVTVPIGDSDVVARIWRVDVGRIPLFLLDTDCADNAPMDRWITGRLYDGDPQTRLAQYSLLGVGGVRALRALGYEPGVIHLNEGHAALAPLELARGYREADGLSQSDALDRARGRTVFTTHTPVPAGNDSYPAEEIEDAVSRLAGELGFAIEELLALGHDVGADAGAPFGVTQAALRMSRAANAVSRRHGEVAREMWQSLWPDRGARGGSDRACHQRRPRAHLDRPADARAAGPPSARRLVRARRRPRGVGARWTTSPPRSCGRRAAASAPSSSTSCGRAASPTAWCAATCAATSTPPPGPLTPRC